MRLQEVLNRFISTDFLLTVDGLCEGLHFREYEHEKKQEYWQQYKNKKIVSISIITNNGKPELYIKLE